ncbi:MAG: tRNA (N(6)-L-threonylcarbamoyladenosine(37)-C(2))-methylthiotransferase MtaB [Candidatus Melainabacteria bacterium]|nr:MAG: tRNA (N(6)-L-threonylcarbamoyladenosine(37)-C(2))-methylthiotransferase MtaB [Candidatus Melainabacteria bacterium]
MKTFLLKSMGCKSNQFEGAIIEENLINAGFEKVSEIKDADLYILNSCSVTHKSDDEALYLLRHAKHTNENIKTLITGCVAQIERDKLLEYDFVDFVLGNNEKLNIVEFLQKNEDCEVGDIMNMTDFHEAVLIDTTKTRASLKIQDGCDNRCAYCIIPFARGKSRSAKSDFIIDQIKSFEKHGFKEVIFTGIHIGQWGKEWGKTILELLKKVEANTNVRYRLGSLYPNEITDELLDFLSKSKQFCPHFHLSLQSACNRTLERMNRRYKVEDYLEQIEKINKLFELPFLGSDVIAGFVGETQEDFETTLKNLEKSGLTAIHTFPYSIRKGTQAEKMEGHLPDKIKEERASAIKEISSQKTKEFLEKNVGTVHNVLVEKHLDKHLNVLKGMSENYITVFLNSDDRNLINTIQKVKITEIKDGKAFGEIILI